MPIDHFDLIAHLYNRAAPFTIPPLFLEELSLPPGGILLDAGGGTGRVAQALRALVHKVLVVDLSRRMLQHAAEKGLMTACAKAEELPFPSNFIDRIIMVDALHHVLDQRQTILELWRVLSPGGKIVIIEPDISKMAGLLIACGEKILLMRSHFLSKNKITDFFQPQGARVRIFQDGINFWVCAEKVR